MIERIDNAVNDVLFRCSGLDLEGYRVAARVVKAEDLADFVCERTWFPLAAIADMLTISMSTAEAQLRRAQVQHFGGSG